MRNINFRGYSDYTFSTFLKEFKNLGLSREALSEYLNIPADNINAQILGKTRGFNVDLGGAPISEIFNNRQSRKIFYRYFNDDNLLKNKISDSLLNIQNSIQNNNEFSENKNYVKLVDHCQFIFNNLDEISENDLLDEYLSELGENLEKNKLKSKKTRITLLEILHAILSFFVMDGQTYYMIDELLSFSTKHIPRSNNHFISDKKINTVCQTILSTKNRDDTFCTITKYSFIKLIDFLNPELSLMPSLCATDSIDKLNNFLPNEIKSVICFYEYIDNYGNNKIAVKLNCDYSVPDFNLKQEALEALFNSYMSCNLHENVESVEKYEINTTISEYINALGFDGHFDTEENKAYLTKIIDNLITTHNHHNKYMYVLFEKKSDGTYIFTNCKPNEKETELVISFVGKFYDDIFSTEYYSKVNFNNKFIDWLYSSKNIGFIEKTIENLIVFHNCFESTIWKKLRKFENVVTYVDSKIIATKEKKVHNSFLMMHARGNFIELYKSLDARMIKQILDIIEGTLLLLDKQGRKVATTLAQGVDSCFSQIETFLREKNLETTDSQIKDKIKSIFSNDRIKWEHNNLSNEKLQERRAKHIGILVEKKPSTKGNIIEYLNEKNNLKSSLIKDKELLSVLKDEIYINLENLERKIELQNSLIQKISIELLNSNEYTTAYITVILSKSQYYTLETLQLARQVSNKALCQHIEKLNYDTIEYAIGYAQELYCDDNANDFKFNIILQLERLHEKRIIKTNHVFLLLEHLLNEDIIKQIELKLKTNDSVIMEMIIFLLGLRIKRKNTWEHVYMYPLVSTILKNTDLFLSLDAEVQCQFFHFAKKYPEYNALLEVYFSIIENNLTLFSTKTMLALLCKEKWDVNIYPNIKNYLLNLVAYITEQKLGGFPLNTKNKYGYKEDTFLYHIIEIFRQEPEITKLLCALCLATTYGSIMYSKNNLDDYKAEKQKNDRARLFNTVLSNPCIKSFCYYYAKKFNILINGAERIKFKNYLDSHDFNKNHTIVRDFALKKKQPLWFGTNVSTESLCKESEETLEVLEFEHKINLEKVLVNDTVIEDFNAWYTQYDLEIPIRPTNQSVVLADNCDNIYLVDGKRLIGYILQRHLDGEDIPTKFIADKLYFDTMESVKIPTSQSKEYNLYENFDKLYLRIKGYMKNKFPDLEFKNKIPEQYQENLAEINNYLVLFYNKYVTTKRLRTEPALSYTNLIESLNDTLDKLEKQLKQR